MEETWRRCRVDGSFLFVEDDVPEVNIKGVNHWSTG
jgi:hypothetical protein